MMIRYLKIFSLLLITLNSFSCYRVPEKIEPHVSYCIQDNYLKHLTSPFPPLSEEEILEPWGKEFIIAKSFSKELDLYRAITTFKRSKILLPQNASFRKEEIEYQIFFSYYLGRRYQEVINTFTHSVLKNVSSDFPAYHDLLIVLYESYLALSQEEKALHILKLITYSYPETSRKLTLSTALIKGDLDTLEKEKATTMHVDSLLSHYDTYKKSVSKAQFLNALIPGAGYLYVGQKQSALTAFLLNGLFIYAAVHFFNKGHLAAGIITTSFEAGWYFGGIYGAGEAAKLYNEQLYEKNAHPILSQNGFFPIYLINYGF